MADESLGSRTRELIYAPLGRPVSITVQLDPPSVLLKILPGGGAKEPGKVTMAKRVDGVAGEGTTRPRFELAGRSVLSTFQVAPASALLTSAEMPGPFVCGREARA